jgi:hypothetical protein
MIKTLNLRRNLITDKGAKELSFFINFQDKYLTDANLNRNRITESGMESLLETVHNSIRLVNFEACYGNYDDSGTTATAFEEEVKAN